MSRYRVYLGCLFLLLVYLGAKSIIRPGFEANLGGDGGSYVAVGERYLATGDVFDLKRPPLYPLIVAWTGGVGDQATEDLGKRVSLPLGILQSALTVVFFIGLFLVLFSHTGNFWFSLVCSSVGLIHRGVFVYDAFIHTEAVTHFLLGGFCLSVYSLRNSRHPALTIIFAAFLTMLTMIRPEMWFLSLIGLTMVTITKLRPWRSALLIAVMISLVPLYYFWRNSVESGFASYSVNGRSIYVHATDVNRWRLEVSPWKTESIRFVLDLYETDPPPDKAIDYYPRVSAMDTEAYNRAYQPFKNAFWESLPQAFLVKPWAFCYDLFELFRYAYSMRDKYTDKNLSTFERSAFFGMGLFQTAVQLISGLIAVLSGPFLLFGLYRGWCRIREIDVFLCLWAVLASQVTVLVILSTSIFPNIRHRQVLHGSLIFLASLVIYEVSRRVREGWARRFSLRLDR